jgi:hypothetical protein
MKIQRIVLAGENNKETRPSTALEEKILSIPIMPGMPSGVKIVFPEEGDQGPTKIPGEILMSLLLSTLLWRIIFFFDLTLNRISFYRDFSTVVKDLISFIRCEIFSNNVSLIFMYTGPAPMKKKKKKKKERREKGDRKRGKEKERNEKKLKKKRKVISFTRFYRA